MRKIKYTLVYNQNLKSGIPYWKVYWESGEFHGEFIASANMAI